MSKLSYQCGWKSISLNEQKKKKSNHEYKAPPAYMGHGKAKHVLICWENFFLCLHNCEENIRNKIKSVFAWEKH